MISGAVPLELAITHLSIAVNTGAFKPLCLHGASSADPVQNFRRAGGRVVLCSQVSVRDSRDLHMDVDPVQEGAGNFGAIPVNFRVGARALMIGIREISAGIWI